MIVLETSEDLTEASGWEERSSELEVDRGSSPDCVMEAGARVEASCLVEGAGVCCG